MAVILGSYYKEGGAIVFLLLRFCRTLLITLLAEQASLKVLDLRIFILICIFQLGTFLFDPGMLCFQ